MALEKTGMHAGLGRFEGGPFLVALGRVGYEANQQNEFNHHRLLDAASGTVRRDADHNKLITNGTFDSAALPNVIFKCLTNVNYDLA